jgi:hypothetical protein
LKSVTDNRIKTWIWDSGFHWGKVLGCKIWNRFVWGTSFVWWSRFRVQTLERRGLYCGYVSWALERASPSYLGTWLLLYSSRANPKPELRFCEIVTGSPGPAPECNRFSNRRFTSQAHSPRSIRVRWELTDCTKSGTSKSLPDPPWKEHEKKVWIINPNRLPW